MTVGSAGDRDEQEADRVASAVMHDLRRRPSEEGDDQDGGRSDETRPIRRHPINRKIQAQAFTRVARSTTRTSPDNVIRRKLTQDETTWVEGWSLSGRWTKEQVAGEFKKVSEQWDAASKAIDEVDTTISPIRSSDGLKNLRSQLVEPRKTVKSWSRAITWSERSAAASALSSAESSVKALSGQAQSLRETHDAQQRRKAADMHAAKERRQEKNRERQAAAATAKREQQAEREKQERAAQQEQEREAAAAEKATQARQQRAEAAKLEKARIKEEQAEKARIKQAELEAAGRNEWDRALRAVAKTTDPNAAATMPRRFATRKLQLAELHTMVAQEEAGFAESSWDIDVVKIAIGNLAALKQRWTDYVATASNEPGAEKQRNWERLAGGNKLWFNAEDLWSFFGYGGAKGASYEMKRFQQRGTSFHFTISGNSMNPPGELWNIDNAFLGWAPDRIFDELFVNGVRVDHRIHATREADSKHVYLGGLDGTGRKRARREFGGDAGVMMDELDKLQKELISKIWAAKAKGWSVR
ncbi:MAG: hypothetical protein OES13_07160 [Acidimicrobiia bacterium]|nr:hypothetical protein [Acidimicrobiia bacterium]